MVQRAFTGLLVQLAAVVPAEVLHSAGAAGVGRKGLVLLCIPNRSLLILSCPVAGQAVRGKLIGLEEVCCTLKRLICPPKMVCEAVSLRMSKHCCMQLCLLYSNETDVIKITYGPTQS